MNHRKRTAVVTGGASGIGRAIALSLAGSGADVAIGSLVAVDGVKRPAIENTYYPDEDELEHTRQEIVKQGVRCMAVPLDVRSDESVQSFLDDANAALGPVDILVNAAGVDLNHPMVGHPDDLWHQILDVNLTGSYRTIKRCLPGMIDRGWGRVIIIASTSASIGYAGKAAYSASKSGVLGLMRCVALEGAAHGVTCNAISPATVDTEMLQSSFMHTAEGLEEGWTAERLREERLGTYPQGRFLQPSEIAAVADIPMSGRVPWPHHGEHHGLGRRDLLTNGPVPSSESE